MKKIEIFLVMTIIAVLAAVAVPAFQHRMNKERTESHIEQAIESEKEACKKVNMNLPQWERTCDDYDDPRCWRLMCTDTQGFLHEILRPICNQHAMHWCK